MHLHLSDRNARPELHPDGQVSSHRTGIVQVASGLLLDAPSPMKKFLSAKAPQDASQEAMQETKRQRLAPVDASSAPLMVSGRARPPPAPGGVGKCSLSTRNAEDAKMTSEGFEPPAF